MTGADFGRAADRRDDLVAALKAAGRQGVGLGARRGLTLVAALATAVAAAAWLAGRAVGASDAHAGERGDAEHDDNRHGQPCDLPHGSRLADWHPMHVEAR